MRREGLGSGAVGPTQLGTPAATAHLLSPPQLHVLALHLLPPRPARRQTGEVALTRGVSWVTRPRTLCLFGDGVMF